MIRHIFFLLLLGVLLSSCKTSAPTQQTPQYPSKSYYYVVAHRTIMDNEGNFKGSESDTLLTSGSIKVTSDSTIEFYHYGQTQRLKGRFNDDRTFTYDIEHGENPGTGLVQFTIGMSASYDGQFNQFFSEPARQQNTRFTCYKRETAYEPGTIRQISIDRPIEVNVTHNVLEMRDGENVLLKGGVEWCGKHTWLVYPDDSETSYWINKSKSQLMIMDRKTGEAEVYELTD